MRKRIIAIGIAVVVVLGMCGCVEGKKSNKTLYEQGLEVISLMKEMASNDAYLKIYSSSSEIQDIISSVGDGDFSEPKATYKIAISGEALLVLEEIAGSEVTEGLSDTLKDYVQSKLKSRITNLMNTAGGAMTLAATSICTGEKIFVSDELTEDVIYLYTYENAVPVAVSFTGGEDGAVLATGNFILNEGFNADTEENIKDFFKEFSVEVEAIKAFKDVKVD